MSQAASYVPITWIELGEANMRGRQRSFDVCNRATMLWERARVLALEGGRTKRTWGRS